MIGKDAGVPSARLDCADMVDGTLLRHRKLVLVIPTDADGYPVGYLEGGGGWGGTIFNVNTTTTAITTTTVWSKKLGHSFSAVGQ